MRKMQRFVTIFLLVLIISRIYEMPLHAAGARYVLIKLGLKTASTLVKRFKDDRNTQEQEHIQQRPILEDLLLNKPPVRTQHQVEMWSAPNPLWSKMNLWDPDYMTMLRRKNDFYYELEWRYRFYKYEHDRRQQTSDSFSDYIFGMFCCLLPLSILVLLYWRPKYARKAFRS